MTRLCFPHQSGNGRCQQEHSGCFGHCRTTIDPAWTSNSSVALNDVGGSDSDPRTAPITRLTWLSARAAVARQSVGVIREIGDGVARVEGLSDVMLNEMLDLGRGITGLALSLEETDVGVVILGDDTQLEEGGEVRATGKLLQVPVGRGLLGRVVNTLGEPLDGKGRIASDVAYPVEKIASGIMRRRPISQPVQTGIMAIDAMIPIGRGQRELIIGDRTTGKTTICIDTIISQARLNAAAEAAGDAEYRPLYCIYVAIGQKQ